MEPKAAEVVPKTIIKEAPVAVVAPGASKATSEMIAKGRQKLEEGKFQEALKIVQSPPIEQRKISEKLEQFGTARNATTGAKELTPAELARRTKAEDGAKLVKKFIEGGYDNMDTSSGGEQEMLRDVFLDAAKLRPMLEQEMQGMNDVQKQAFAERYLKDPRFSKEVRGVFQDLLNPEKKLVDISKFQDDKETADLDLEDAKAEKADHQRGWDQNDLQLAEHEARSAKRGKPPVEGAKYLRLQGLTNEIQVLRNDLNANRTDLATAQGDVKRFRDELVNAQRFASIRAGTGTARSEAEIKRDFDTATLRETSARERVSQLDGELKTKEGEAKIIDEEHQTLIERRKELDAKKRTLERAVKDKEREAAKKQWALQDAKTVREGEEQDLSDKFNSVFSEASDKVLNNDLEKANEAFNAELEVRKNQATDNNEKALLDGIERGMLVDAPIIRKKGLLGFRTKEETRPMSKEKVISYHGTLMKNGPLEPAVRLLITQDNPAAGVKGVKYSEPEARAILANKAFADKMLPIVTEQILARKMLVGGITQEDIHIVVNAQWGKDMLDKARDRNKAYFDAVEKDMGPGAFDAPNFHEKLAEKIKKHPWWLYLILGIPFLVGGAAASKSLENIGK